MVDTLHIEYMDLAKLVAAPRNPRSHDAGAIDGSMSRFGYIEPLVVNEATGRLVVGHGRREALMARKASGQRPPARVRVVKSKWFVPVLRGVSFTTDAEAEGYLVAANRTQELGGWEADQLTKTLADLAAQGPLDGIGYDGDDVDAMLKRLAGGQEDRQDRSAPLPGERGHAGVGHAPEGDGLPTPAVMLHQVRKAAGLSPETSLDPVLAWEEALKTVAGLLRLQLEPVKGRK